MYYAFHQGKQPLGALLKAEGVQLIKRAVFDNLHLKAGAEEDTIMEELVRELREVKINKHLLKV